MFCCKVESRHGASSSDLRTFGLAHSTSSGIAEVNDLIEGTFKLVTPEKLSGDLATLINRLVKDRQLREKFGRADRKRAEEHV